MTVFENLSLMYKDQRISKYVDDTIKLIKYCVFKDTKVINNFAKLDHGVVYQTYDEGLQFDNNKFYLNIRGLPHPTNNQGIQFYSYDTRQYETLSLAVFKQHPRSVRKYSFDSPQYLQLIEDNPEDEMYIRGIINPVDEETAYRIYTSAPDGTIVSYPKEFVEEYEVTLIKDLERWAIDTYNRWDVKGFSLSDDFYTAAQNALFFHQAVNKVHALRLERCKTFEAHSFHIRNYFASHYGIDIHYDYLNREQVIYLYKNLKRLRNYPGFQDTFKEVLLNIAKPKLVPVSTTRTIANSVIDEEYRPVVEYRRTLTSEGYNYNVNAEDIYSYNHFRNRIEARQNPEYLYPRNREYRDIQNSNSNVHTTKFLESDMVDEDYSYSPTLEEFLTYHWAAYVHDGRYEADIQFNNSIDNKSYTLKSRDAFIYFMYLTMKFCGLEHNELKRITIPMVTLEPNELTSERLNLFVNVARRNDKKHVENITNEILSKYVFPEIDYIENVDFYESIKEIYYTNVIGFRLLLANTHDIHNAGAVRRMELNAFDYRIVDFDIDDLEKWVDEKELPKLVAPYPNELIEDTILELLNEGAGLKYGELTRLSNIQKNIIQLMENFFSYTIRFIYDTLEDTIYPLRRASRVGYDLDAFESSYIVNPASGVLDPYTCVHISEVIFKYDSDKFFNVDTCMEVSAFIDTSSVSMYSMLDWNFPIFTASKVLDLTGSLETQFHVPTDVITNMYLKELDTSVFFEGVSTVTSTVENLFMKEAEVRTAPAILAPPKTEAEEVARLETASNMVVDAPMVLPQDLQQIKVINF